MRIGIVSYWFNRGQATVGRYIRSIFCGSGHKTFILARPTKEKFARPSFVAKKDVWNQEGVTTASNFLIPYGEYEHWVKSNKIDVVFCDQNYQFEELSRLRKIGVALIGRFVWESFGESHVEGAKTAFDIVYSFSRCEQDRYKHFGIDSPLLRWGIHPELLQYRNTPKRSHITFFYPGGYLSPRKSTGAILEAFTQASSPGIRLIIKVQNDLQAHDLIIPANRDQTIKRRIDKNHPALLKRAKLLEDPRVTVITEDCDSDSYYKLFSSCHVSLAPSRWEGLGLHLFEAIGFGVPTIVNDNPPMNEVIKHKKNGLLVPAFLLGQTKSGISAFEPELEKLAQAIVELSNMERLDALTQSTRQFMCCLDWKNTVSDYLHLLKDISGKKHL